MYLQTQKRIHITKIKTNSGHEICANLFVGADVGKVLVIAGAMGTRQSYYSKFADYISTKGITVITFDYNGIGQSLNGSIIKVNSTLKEWGVNDLESVLVYARTTYPDSRIYILGHSVGGQLTGLAPSSQYSCKIILVASQSGYWKFWNGASKYQMWANWYVLFPTLVSFFGYMPSKKISGMENLPAGVARQWRKWCVSPRYLFDELNKEELYFKTIKCPVHSYSCADDIYAPKAAVDWLANEFKNAAVERVHIKPSQFGRSKIGHFGFFKQEAQDNIWELFYRHLAETGIIKKAI